MFSARNRKPFISSPILWPRHELAIIYLATTIVVIQSELELEQLLCVHIWGNGVPHILNGKFVSNGQLINVLVTWRPVAQHNRRSGMENFKLFVIHLWNELSHWEWWTRFSEIIQLLRMTEDFSVPWLRWMTPCWMDNELLLLFCDTFYCRVVFPLESFFIMFPINC